MGVFQTEYWLTLKEPYSRSSLVEIHFEMNGVQTSESQLYQIKEIIFNHRNIRTITAFRENSYIQGYINHCNE